MTRTRRALLAAFAASTLTAANLEAVVPPKSPLAEKDYRHPDLYINQELLAVGQLERGVASKVQRDMDALGVAADSAFYNPRAGRLSSLIVSVPLVPGTGVGNELKWVALGVRPTDESAVKDLVWNRVVGYLRHHEAALRVDVSELSAPRIGVFEHGNIIQVFSQRVINGIPVRGAVMVAVINHGNLILLGFDNWGDDASLTATPLLGPDQARLAMSEHAQPFFIDGYEKGTHLEYIPMASGNGYDYRLAWVVKGTVQGVLGNFEALVDAVSGELLAFEDKNQYAARRVLGGVYPVSNDQRLPDGVEIAGFPMPFATVATSGGPVTANAGGGIGCATGNVTTALVGQYVQISDTCGAINETAAAGDIDLGFGPTPTSTDCAIPAGHSPGDTKSSRSAFYELSRMNEAARGYLPSNDWLQQSLVANVNLNQTCNAFWDGATTNFFRSSLAAGCANTGEIAAIFDHEWGHGMDNNGVNPNISGPGEAIADIHAVLRLNTSCVGRGFFPNDPCGGYGDACDPGADTCTGVRDVEFMNHRCNQPHTVSWITGGFTSAQCGGTGSAPACPAAGQRGPCNRETHCEGMVPAEAGWDLQFRDLRAAPFNLDSNTALEIATRLSFLGSQEITNWYTCSNGGGCGVTGGYLQFLGADDDDGNLGNGTPHMTAIRAAFERHGIHCATPAAVDGGCANGPTLAPVLFATPRDQGANLTWSAVPGAARYYVYRTEGVNGGTFGKVKIGETTGTTFAVGDLLNGRTYFFTVLPVGASTSCFGIMSNIATMVPAPGANLAIQAATSFTISGGDGDEFLDNCETANVTFNVENTGTGPLTNVRLVGVTFISHNTSILTTQIPAPIAATLADCATAAGAFSFVLQGASLNEIAQIRIDVTADQLAGQVRSHTMTISELESDWQNTASRTFSYDADLENWTVTEGTFVRAAGGANGTPFHVSSSENLAFQCDVIRSPAIRLTAGSTLSLENNYDIEPTDPTLGPYDRANVGVVDVLLGTRTVVSPTGGQLYTLAAGPTNFAGCDLEDQAGWNATSAAYPNFAPSTWSSAALNPGGVFTGRKTFLEIRYGTDELLHPEGFDFDQLTLTNFDLQGADTQPNACVVDAVAPAALVVDDAGNDVMEPGELAVMEPTWRNTGTTVLALTGSTSGFTGPAGGVYTNPDSSANYGSVNAGAQASCASTGDCYSVMADAATRPITHWDTTIIETVSPTSAAKTWTLHVGASFTDVPTTNGFYKFIETILHKNVTGGCTTTEYCPTASTTREAMAVFVLVSKEPSGYVPPDCVAGSEAFADVPASSGFCRWVEELARRGVVTGCGGNNYCPTSSATREQMAVFVLRTLDATIDPPQCVAGSERFDDVPASSGFCRWIEELASRGVVTGCTTTSYCPAADVSREQMGVFLAVTFGLTLYGL